ncbi:MAG: hypothetical protein ACYC2I_04205 [Elusimicrobiales bacterium]
MKTKALFLQKAALVLMLAMLSGWAAAAAGLTRITFVVVGVAVGMTAAFLLRKGGPAPDSDPYLRLAAAYGSLLIVSAVIAIIQGIQYYREARFSPWFGYLLAALLIPQVVFPAVLSGAHRRQGGRG